MTNMITAVDADLKLFVEACEVLFGTKQFLVSIPDQPSLAWLHLDLRWPGILASVLGFAVHEV